MKKISLKAFSMLFLILYILNYIFVVDSYAKPNRVKQARSSGFTLSIDEFDFRSASFSWEYPDDIKFNIGDYLNLILIDDETGYMGEIPVVSVAHGVGDIDLANFKSCKVNTLLPSTNYKVQLEIVQLFGDGCFLEESFTTKDFQITDMFVEGAEKDVVKGKDIKINWKTTPESVTFTEGDKVEIFMKRLSDNDFPRQPVFESKEDVKTASIKLPEFEQIYDFNIVYTIAGNKFVSDFFFVELRSGGLNFKVEDIKSNSAKMVWTFVNEDALSENSEIKIFLKEDKNIEYPKEPLFTLKGKEELLKTKEYLANKLKFETKYHVKVQLILETITKFDRKIPALVESEYNFVTNKFDIKDLKVTSGNENKVRVNWDFDGDSISFSEGDTLSIYIKESLQDVYSETQIIKENLSTNKEVEVVLPKYNTKYDIRLIYSVGGKFLCRYITHTIELPKIDFNVEVLSNDSVKFKLSFDQNKIKFEDNSAQDKVEIFVKKSGEGEEYKSISFETEDPKGADQRREDPQNNLTREEASSTPENPETQNIVKRELVVKDISTALGGEQRKVLNYIEKKLGELNELDERNQVMITQQLEAQSSDSENKYDFKIVVTKDGAILQEEFYAIAMKQTELQIVGVTYKKL